VFWLGSCLRELSRAVEVLRGLPRGSLFLLLIFSTVFLFFEVNDDGELGDLGVEMVCIALRFWVGLNSNPTTLRLSES